MCGTESRTQLPLASSASGCSCCSTQDSAVPAARPGTSAVEFAVDGLTCGHCVQTVEKAVSSLEGVESASVQLVPGGRSRLLIGGRADEAAVREAVTAAGYTFAAN